MRSLHLHLTPLVSASLTMIIAFSFACREQTQVPETPHAPYDPARGLVERMIPSFDATLREHAEAAATGGKISAYLDREAARPWNARVAGGIKYADLFQKLYDQRRNRKLFAQIDGTRARGDVIVAVLAAAQRHGLDPGPYHLARIAELDARLEEIASENPPWNVQSLAASEAETLVTWVKIQELDPNDPQTPTKIFEALVRSEPEASPIPRITTDVLGYREVFSKTASLTAELELRIADGALRYARDMKHFNLAREDWRDIKKAGGSKALIYGRLETTFKELAAASVDEVDAVFSALEPQHPQYAKLLSALERYRSIAASGGWSKAKRTKVEVGASSKRILALRERLMKEGYLDAADATDRTQENTTSRATHEAEAAVLTGGNAPSSDAESAPKKEEKDRNLKVVDERLLDAVKTYQETHQFRANGEVTGGFWRSLNKPVETRIRQIEITLQRWRESRYRGEPNYVFVNIPDFHAEVYEDHERKMRFRVVVGNRQKKCDPKTKKWVYPNATPIQIAQLDHLIVNPSWWLPSRIIDEEIMPEVRSDSNYLEDNDYEWVKTRDGKERLRQKPGDQNALGRVKFIFPNPHNTYMHDTPKKRYFQYPLRAFSHGCVRVHEPIAFAEYLLEKDGLATSERLDELLDSDRTKKFDVKDKMPVFFEYYVVRVDEQGRANFLADIYQLDKLRNAEDPEAMLECNVRRKVVEEPDDDGDDTTPEAETSDIGP